MFLIIAVGFNSATYVGFQVNHIDLAPNHAGVMMGVTNGLANCFSIVAPLAVGFIVSEDVSTILNLCFGQPTHIFFLMFSNQLWKNGELSFI